MYDLGMVALVFVRENLGRVWGVVYVEPQTTSPAFKAI